MVVEAKGFNKKQMRKWQLLLGFGLVSVLICSFITLIMFANNHILGFSIQRFTPVRVIGILMFYTMLLIYVLFKWFNRLAKPIKITLNDTVIEIVEDMSIKIDLQDITSVFINNVGDYAKLVVSTKHKKFKYHFGVANLSTKMFHKNADKYVFCEDINTIVEYFKRYNFEVKTEINVKLNIERYTFIVVR